jgi:uncharacterized protein YacL
VDLLRPLEYVAIGVAVALLISWLSGRPLSFRPANVASGLLFVAALYLLRAVGVSFELSILFLIVASGLWYVWRRVRAQTA